MKIALFTDTFYPQINGVANTVHHYARALSKRGHTVRVYTVSTHSAESIRKDTGNIFGVYIIPSINAFVYSGERLALPIMSGVYRDIIDFKPDIIHSHTPFGTGRIAAKAARMTGVPLIGTHHTFFDHYLQHIYLDFNWTRSLTWKLTVNYYDQCDIVISPTNALAEHLKQNHLRPPIVLLPNMIDTDRFSPRTAGPKVKQEKILVYMGRLSHEKSVDDVIRVAAIIMKKDPQIRLHLIGDGKERASLEALAKKEGVFEKTTFTGCLTDNKLVEALQNADVFITASRSENMPLSVLEAMAVGLPIVAVRSLGLSEMIEDGENGFLVSPNAKEGVLNALADRALVLLTDGELCKRCGSRARELSLHYSEDAIVERLLEMYRTVSESQKRSANVKPLGVPRMAEEFDRK
jgi:glycosyltransferase involved in cell wall biosynthesis